MMGKIQNGIGHQHLIIEASYIITDHQIGMAEKVNEIRHAVFRKDLISSSRCAVGYAN